MSKNNFFFLLIVFLLSNLLVRGPDLARFLKIPADKVFTGQASWFDPWDLNVYFAAIGWGQRGHFTFANVYDTLAQDELAIFPLYTFLGRVFHSFSLSNALIFHLAGIITSFFFLIILWWFINFFEKDRFNQKVLLSWLVFAGGFGWLSFPDLLLPDLGQPGFTFESALRRPHEAVSLSLFLVSLGVFWQAFRQPKTFFFLSATLAALLMSFFHPYSLLPLAAILGVFGLQQWFKARRFQFFLPPALVALAGLVYYLTAGKTLLINPGFGGLLGQVQHSYSPLKIVLGWGWFAPFIFLGLIKTPNLAFIKIWFLTHWLTTYLPLGFQKLFIKGLWLPVLLLALQGVLLATQKAKFLYRPLVFTLLFLGSFSNLFTFYKRLTEPAQNPWFYLSQDENQILHYLNTRGQNEEGVLAEYRLANQIPALTSKRVYAGHPFQTPDFDQRIVPANLFLQAKMTDSEAATFINQAKITWIIAPANPYPQLLQLALATPSLNLYKFNH
jgi:hypothetical protein